MCQICQPNRHRKSRHSVRGRGDSGGHLDCVVNQHDGECLDLALIEHWGHLRTHGPDIISISWVLGC